METAFIGVLMGLMGVVGGSILWFVLDQRFREKLQQQKKQAEHTRLAELEAAKSNYQDKLETEKQNLQAQAEAIQLEKQTLSQARQSLACEQQALEQAQQNLQEEREKLAGLNAEQARQALIQSWETHLEEDPAKQLLQYKQELQSQKQALAQEILTRAIQGTAISHIQEHLVIYLPLPEREMVGRIIGRQGKNIQALQEISGCDISIDRDEKVIAISAFDPLRRELARLSLQALIQDGRINPERIQQTYADQTQILEKKYVELGQETAQKAQVKGLSSEIITLLGQLNFQTSLGQNLMTHALEVSQLAGHIAKQLDCQVDVARRAGLLHDLGKGLPETPEAQSHCERGVDFAKRHGEAPEILHAMAAHHFEVPPQTAEAVIVQIADSLSAARPGARSQSLERHTERLEALEKLALEFAGVEKALVLKAGREVRVLVDPDQLNDAQMSKLATEIARKIENELELPGQVKVSVIREFEANDYARS